MFAIFHSFEIEVYLSILSIIIIMSSVVAIHRKSLKAFFSTLWSYASVILSDYYALKVESTIDRLLTGAWLMACTVLLAGFSGLFRDQLMKAKPILWIDSWEDLFEWKDVEIQTFDTEGLAVFVNKSSDTEMAKNFKSRIKDGEFLVREEYVGNKSCEDVLDFEGVKNGRTAIAGQLHYLDVYKQNLVNDYNLTEDIDFHISQNGISESYMFLTSRNRMNQILASKFDLMYSS